MSSNSNTLYVAVDASGVQSGASVTINLINQMINATNSFNTAISNAGNSMTNTANQTVKSGSEMSKIIKRLSGDFSVMGGMIAAIQPVQMLKSFSDEIIKVNQVYTGFIATIAASTGEYVDAGKAYEYVKDVSIAYGAGIEQLLNGYAKLKGATSTLLNTEQIDHLFESITAVSSVMHLPAQTVERIFMAVTQIASKGQLMMEELKSQLGEHLPGVLAIAAESMGLEISELIAKMKKGEISAKEFLTAFPTELNKRFAGAAELASKSLNSVISRFHTAVFDIFKNMSTNSIALGFSEAISAVTDLLSESNDAFVQFSDVIGGAALKLAEFIRKLTPEDLQKFGSAIVDTADAIGWLFSKTIQIIGIIKDYSSAILTGITVLAGWRVAITYGVASMAALSAAYGGATGAAGLLTKATNILSLAFKSLFGIFAVWSIGQYLYDEFEIARKGILYFTTGFLALPDVVEKVFNHISAAIKNWVNDFAGVKIFDVSSTNVQRLKGEVTKQFKAISDAVNSENAKFKAKKQADLNESVIKKLNINVPDNADLQKRLAENERKARESLSGDNTFSKKSSGSGANRLDRDFGIRTIRSRLQEASKAYDEYSQKLKTMSEMDQISTTQMFNAQLEALRLYTDKSKKLLNDELLATKDPKVRERLNSELIKLEHDYQSKSTKLLRDAFNERRKINEELYKLEVEGRVRTQSPTEKFLSDWSKNEGMVAAQARVDGDNETANRFVDALMGKMALIRRDEKIGIESFFQTDTQKAATELFLKFDEMKQRIKASFEFTDEEKKNMFNFMDENLIIQKNNIIVKSFSDSAGIMANSFAQIGDALKGSVGETSAVYKTLFAISKAFAIAQAMLDLNAAIANAATIPTPDAATKFANMAAVASAVGNLVSQISSVTFSGAFDKGGNIPAGKWGIVGEVGPEIVKGPANVTSRKDTAAMLKEAAGNSGGGSSIHVGSINVRVEKDDKMTPNDQAQMIGQAVEQHLRSLVVNELREQSRPGNMFNRNSTRNAFS